MKTYKIPTLAQEIVNTYNNGKKKSYYIYGDEKGIIVLVSNVCDLFGELKPYYMQLHNDWPGYEHEKVVVNNKFKIYEKMANYYQDIVNWTGEMRVVPACRGPLEDVKKHERDYRRKHEDLDYILFIVGSKPFKEAILEDCITIPAEHRVDKINYLSRRFRCFNMTASEAIEVPRFVYSLID